MSTAPASVNLTGLLDRADEYARAGDPKAAMSFYQAALQAGRGAPQFDPRTVERLRSAQAFIQERASEFQQKLNAALAAFRPEADAVHRVVRDVRVPAAGSDRGDLGPVGEDLP